MKADDVFEYYDGVQSKFSDMGYNVYTPMFGKSSVRTDICFKAHSHNETPIVKNHAIFNRDKWMVKQADVLYANFLGAERVSIGSMMELAWGNDNDKHVVVVMEKDNIHMHAFVLEAATIVFECEDDAIDYLNLLIDKL